MKIRSIVALAVALLLVFQGHSFADTIFGPAPGQGGGPLTTGPGTATDYDFGDFGSSTVGPAFTPTAYTSLTNFSVALAVYPLTPGQIQPETQNAIVGDGFTGGFTSYTTPNVGALPKPQPTAFTTGVAWDTNGTSTLTKIATFTALNPGNFTVAVLNNNTPAGDGGQGAFENSVIGVSVQTGPSTTGPITTLNETWNGTNQFATFTLNGATAGEVFNVYATPNGANGTAADAGSIGGLIFDFTPASGGGSGVPEPSSVVALLGLGAMGLFFAARSRMSKGA